MICPGGGRQGGGGCGALEKVQFSCGGRNVPEKRYGKIEVQRFKRYIIMILAFVCLPIYCMYT